MLLVSTPLFILEISAMFHTQDRQNCKPSNGLREKTRTYFVLKNIGVASLKVRTCLNCNDELQAKYTFKVVWRERIKN